MRARAILYLTLLTALGVAPAEKACSEVRGRTIVLEAGRLAEALRTLSVRTGTDLLFSPAVVGELRSPSVADARDVEAALRTLLAGSRLTFRRTAAGAYVILPEPEATEAPVVPELLVVGRRTQNEDIRRTENDIQPYAVTGSVDLASAHVDNVDQFARSRLPSASELQGPSQDPIFEFGSHRSQVNLRGLGPDQTLVLIDGARMPGLPSVATLGASLGQPDLNGLPLFAIDRIVTLTGAAGGIYGPGATGGVVNVVLKRDYRGADLGVGYGVSGRGDAAHSRIDARIGFTPDQGRTDVMIAFSRSVANGLPQGARGYAVASRQLQIVQNPALYPNAFTTTNGLILVTNPELTLKPAFGGTSLGSTFTTAPIGYGGVASDGAATLIANAGKPPIALSPDGLGDGRSLIGSSSTKSLLVGVRHHFGDDIELFADLIGLQNDGRAVAAARASTVGFVLDTAPNNPFRQPVAVIMPLPGFDAVEKNQLGSLRLTTGVIAQLPGDWTAEASVRRGWLRNVVDLQTLLLNADFAQAIQTGTPGAAGEPTPDPFGAWADFYAALQAYKVADHSRLVRANRLGDVSVRLAGPLLTTRAGPVSLSLLAERRREDVSASPFSTTRGNVSASSRFPPFSQVVSSAYGELRVPVTARDAGLWPLHGLEVQLAVRHDDNRSILSELSGSNVTVGAVSARQAATAYTAGFRVFPLERLLVRASVATGALPPTPAQTMQVSSTFLPVIADPKRSGQLVGDEASYTILAGGSPRLRPARARTVSFGVVINPDGGDHPRVSIDYTHTEMRNEIIGAPSVAFFLQNEGSYPGRIDRAPLTSADAAAGFTGGIVTQIDASALNAGRTTSDEVDVSVEQGIALGSGDMLRLYGLAAWEPRLKRLLRLGLPYTEYVGFADGPLRLRGNAGVEWYRGAFNAGVNLQYSAGYAAVAAAKGTPAQLSLPGVRVPPQVYVDLSVRYRLHPAGGLGPARDVDLSLGIENIFDKSPRTVTNTELGYSFFGDPRGRRLDASVVAHF